VIVVVPCGGRKSPRVAPAGRLYTGPYHRACLAYARRCVPEGRIFILSAKHGLLGLADVVAPYDLRMGHPGSVTADVVREQAAARGLLGEAVVALGGKDYVAICRAVWPGCRTPLTGIGGQGKQMAYLYGAARS
jgi:hypothetical protein